MIALIGADETAGLTIESMKLNKHKQVEIRFTNGEMFVMEANVNACECKEARRVCISECGVYENGQGLPF